MLTLVPADPSPRLSTGSQHHGKLGVGYSSLATRAITAFPTGMGDEWAYPLSVELVKHSPPLASGAHLNSTLAYAMPHGVWIGANGYYLKQVTNPSVNGVQLPIHPSKLALSVRAQSGIWGSFSSPRMAVTNSEQ